MNVGILGSGDVGTALARGFLKHGHAVAIGTRDPAKLAGFAKEQPGVKVGSFEETAKFGDVVVLASLGTAAEEVLALAGARNLDGKVLIDTTNPLDWDDNGPRLAFGFDDSLGERVQRAVPNARVVKAFNIVGNADMVDPSFDGGPPSMFVAGNDDGAKRTVTEILKDFGWDVVDLGGIESSRYLEPMCLAWVMYAVRNGSRHHAFKLLR
jgi:hypothetical protein